MLSSDLIGPLWKSQRSTLIVMSILILLNLTLYVALDQLLVPRVAEQENLFIKRQGEVRDILRNREGVTKTPEHLFVLAKQDLAAFKQRVPAYKDFTALIEELVLLSSRSGLALTQISYKSDHVKEVNLLRFDLSFNLTGEYAQLKRFIHSLEQSNRLIAINEIALQNEDKGGVSLRLRLQTYFHSERAAS